MQKFLINGNEIHSYEDLIVDLNSSSNYKPMYKTDSLYDYFKNLIKALSQDKPLILIDSDLTDKEIETMNLGKVNQNIPHEFFRLYDPVTSHGDEHIVWRGGGLRDADSQGCVCPGKYVVYCEETLSGCKVYEYVVVVGNEFGDNLLVWNSVPVDIVAVDD